MTATVCPCGLPHPPNPLSLSVPLSQRQEEDKRKLGRKRLGSEVAMDPGRKEGTSQHRPAIANEIHRGSAQNILRSKDFPTMNCS